MLISLDTLVAVAAIVVVGLYLVAQGLTGVDLARLGEARRIAAETLRDKSIVNPLFGEHRDGAARDHAVIERLIAYHPSKTDRVLHTERRGSP